jgi:hypothetical protein
MAFETNKNHLSGITSASSFFSASSLWSNGIFVASDKAVKNIFFG